MRKEENAWKYIIDHHVTDFWIWVCSYVTSTPTEMTETYFNTPAINVALCYVMKVYRDTPE